MANSSKSQLNTSNVAIRGQLTKTLREKLHKDVNYGVQTINPAEYISGMIVQFAMFGRCETLNGGIIVLAGVDHLDLIKWIFDRVDGTSTPVTDLDSSNDQPQKIIYIPENQRTASIEK